MKVGLGGVEDKEGGEREERKYKSWGGTSMVNN